MGHGLQRLGKAGLGALHALLQARATALHPWLFTATGTAASAGAMMAEAARIERSGRGAS
ncbi:hypothetical protein [Azospirillum rugosum]|uniref:Uncharacterized protein n=1 Tax=Azospirillum rugosum TaxID=416170 RepID=A0ABS4SL45_9PROT|nr:hypothetical protein [Azospirillum rugosum]MBP2292808.1 hypothetical protein [Azospirillum rugosum]MDQ0527067.1 hypothetical protein [Azospirillum rugosum]